MLLLLLLLLRLWLLLFLPLLLMLLLLLLLLLILLEWQRWMPRARTELVEPFLQRTLVRLVYLLLTGQHGLL